MYIIPLLIMLFVGVGVRIRDHGLTVQRCGLLSLGILLFGLAIYFIVSRKKDIRVVPVSLAFLAALTLWGPTSIYSISVSSQLSRARLLLEKNGMLTNDRAQASGKVVSWADQIELRSIISYLLEYHGRAPLEIWFSNDLLEKTKLRRYHQNVSPVLDYLKVSPPGERSSDRIDTKFYANTSSRLVDISGYDHLLVLDRNTKRVDFKFAKRDMSVVREGKIIELHVASKAVLALLLDSMIRGAYEFRKTYPSQQVPNDIFVVNGGGDHWKARLVLDEFEVSRDEKGNTDLFDMKGYLLIKYQPKN
jgi:Domain of unknown function (DUF4153)